MKKFVQNIWVRLIACVVCTVSVLGLAVTTAGVFFFAEYPDKNTILEEGNERLLQNYALYASDYLDSLEEDKFFDTINAYITIEKKQYLSNEDTEPTITDSYSNMPEGVEPTYTLDKLYVGTEKHYSSKSIFAAFNSYYYHNGNNYMLPTPITGYAFDVNTGLFYYHTAVGYFKANYVYVSKDGVSYDYRLTVKNGEEFYLNNYYVLELNPREYREWDWVSLSGKKMGITETYDGNQVQIIKDSSTIENELHTENFYVEGYHVYYATDRVDSYTISMALAEDLTHHDFFYEYKNIIDKVYSFQENIVGMQWACFLIFIIAIVLLFVSAPEDKERLRFFHKIPVLMFTGMVVVVEVILFWLLVKLLQAVWSNTMTTMTIDNLAVLILDIVFIMLFIGFIYLANISTRIRSKTFGRYSEWYYISRPLVCMTRLAKENVSLFWKGIIVMLGISFVEFMLLIITRWEPDSLVTFFLIGKMIEVPIVIYVLFQMKQLQSGAKRIAAGDSSQPIDTSKLLWEFKKHGENINKVGEGISLAVEEKIKSERFKTELITNVSHDIKTPLTSIINYVDLIKKQEVTDSTMAEYVDVLDRQSARLKKLIEDLMEASKASTGNIAVHFEECNMDVLLTQVIGEFEDKLMASGLEVVVDKPEEPVMVIADGRHMWRILDNLMNNACKYSQPNTRVYVSLVKEGQTASIVFKNISKTALNIPSEQLMQRFVRGDSSRHTEGSGLGLSIAQSLTELMNGTLKLDIDGDLFKVILKFNAIA